jgi:hypothetical protein
MQTVRKGCHKVRDPEPVKRLRQSSSRAALIYQHATHDSDAAIADSLSSMITEHRSKICGS